MTQAQTTLDLLSALNDDLELIRASSALAPMAAAALARAQERIRQLDRIVTAQAVAEAPKWA